MKVYFWIMIMMINAHASSNPFNLKESFEKLEAQQENLIQELTKYIDLNSTKKSIQKVVGFEHKRDEIPSHKIEVMEENSIPLDKKALTISKAMPNTPIYRLENETNGTQGKRGIDIYERERSLEVSENLTKEMNSKLSNVMIEKNDYNKNQTTKERNRPTTININQLYRDAVEEMSKGN